MVIGYHLVWTAYGWWLPNDPRGSTSHHLRKVDLAPLGEVHHGRKRIQPAGKVIREFYDGAKDVLQHPLLTFSDTEVSAIASAFADVIEERRYTCYACAVMPDHIHVLIRKHRDQAETMIAQFQDASSAEVLKSSQSERTLDHPVWGGPGWKVYLDSRADIQRTIRYIEENPVKIGRPRQVWDFVRKYDGWVPGIVSRQRPSAKPQADGK